MGPAPIPSKGFVLGLSQRMFHPCHFLYILWQAHPTLAPGNGDIIALTATGAVQTKPSITSITGHTVSFADGTNAEYDVIIAATGSALRNSHKYLMGANKR